MKWNKVFYLLAYYIVICMWVEGFVHGCIILLVCWQYQLINRSKTGPKNYVKWQTTNPSTHFFETSKLNFELISNTIQLWVHLKESEKNWIFSGYFFPVFTTATSIKKIWIFFWIFFLDIFLDVFFHFHFIKKSGFFLDFFSGHKYQKKKSWLFM